MASPIFSGLLDCSSIFLHVVMSPTHNIMLVTGLIWTQNAWSCVMGNTSQVKMSSIIQKEVLRYFLLTTYSVQSTPYTCPTKRRLAWHQPNRVFFWYDSDYKIVLCSLHKLYCGVPDRSLVYVLYINLAWFACFINVLGYMPRVS